MLTDLIRGMFPKIHRPVLQTRQPPTLAPIVNLVPSCHLYRIPIVDAYS
jgi:hypothetical protein